MSIAILTAALVIVFGATGTRHQSFMVNAQQKSETAEVKIDNFSFEPGTLTVPVGIAVTWTNRDDIPHTVVSTDGAFKSHQNGSSREARATRRAHSLSDRAVHRGRCL